MEHLLIYYTYNFTSAKTTYKYFLPLLVLLTLYPLFFRVSSPLALSGHLFELESKLDYYKGNEPIQILPKKKISILSFTIVFPVCGVSSACPRIQPNKHSLANKLFSVRLQIYFKKDINSVVYKV